MGTSALYVAQRRGQCCVVAQQGFLVISAPLADSARLNTEVVLGKWS